MTEVSRFRVLEEQCPLASRTHKAINQQGVWRKNEDDFDPYSLFVIDWIILSGITTEIGDIHSLFYVWLHASTMMNFFFCIIFILKKIVEWFPAILTWKDLSESQNPLCVKPKRAAKNHMNLTSSCCSKTMAARASLYAVDLIFLTNTKISFLLRLTGNAFHCSNLSLESKLASQSAPAIGFLLHGQKMVKNNGELTWPWMS